MKYWKRYFFATAIAMLILLPGAGFADVYWESVQTTRSMPGQPDGTQTIRQFLSDLGSRMETDDQITLIDFKKMRLYDIDPGEKTYMELDMNAMGNLPEMDENQKSLMAGFMKQMMDTVKVTPTQERKTINGYDCRKYQVNFMGTTGDYWLSKEVDGYQEIKLASQKAARAFENNPILKQSNIMAMMSDLEGFPVETDMQFLGGRIVTTLKKMETGPIDPKLFSVPAGYRKISPE